MKISTLVQYFLTLFTCLISVALSLFIWLIINPYYFEIIMEWRGDGVIWAFFGRWGVLFIWTVINILSLPIFGLFGLFMGSLIKGLSPNNTFTLYSYLICSVIVLIYFIYHIWTNTELDFYGVIQS